MREAVILDVHEGLELLDESIANRDLYVLLSGRLRRVDPAGAAETLLPGAVFGERNHLLDRVPAPARILSEAPSRVVHLRHGAIARLCASRPLDAAALHASLARAMARPSPRSPLMRAAVDPRAAPAPVSEATRVRRQFREAVRGCTRPAPTTLAALGDIAAAALSAVIVAAAHRAVLARSLVAGVTLYPVAALLIATRLRALGNMIHESVHGTLTRDPTWNRALGEVLAWLDATSLPRYAHEHFTHHRHLGDPVRDLDFAGRVRFGFGDAHPRPWRQHGLRPLTLIHVPWFLRPRLWSDEDAGGVRVLRALGYVWWAALAWRVGARDVLLHHLVPYVTLYQVVRYWSDAADHAGLLGAREVMHRARNHILPWAPLNALLQPRHDQFHLVHHLFPAVPVRDLARVHALLLRDPAYAARDHRFVGVLSPPGDPRGNRPARD
ncbi:MAG: fatty acid desaturase [Polyangiales bacterium]